MAHKLIARAQAEGTPLVGGNSATFVWQGPQPPRLDGDFNDWGRSGPVGWQAAAPELWIYKVEVTSDTYMEYMYWVGDERKHDPYNKRLVWNGVDGYNHYFAMPEYVPNRLARSSRSVPHGKVMRYMLEGENLVTNGRRAVYLYQPPTKEPVPLVVVWDGKDYLRRASLNVIVDNLIAQKRIRPLALALVHNGGRARMVEYACSEATLGLLYYQVLPLAQKNLNLMDYQANPGAYGVMGASMGGLMALYAGCRMPQVFGHVLSQSGAFALGEYDMVVFDLIRDGSRKPLKIWMDVGKYDFASLISANQCMAELLQQKGYPLEYRIYPAGHNYSSWRNEVGHGLEFLFGN